MNLTLKATQSYFVHVRVSIKKNHTLSLTHLKHRLYPIAKASEMGKALNNMKNELD